MLHPLLIEFKPCLARLLARTRDGKPLTSRRLARASLLTRDRVDEISYSDSWDTFRNKETWAFLAACGVTPTTARRQREFIRRNDWGHLSRSHNKKYYARLMNLWIQSLPNASAE